MAEIPRMVSEAGIQIGFRGGKAPGIFGMDGYDDTLMDGLVHLREFVAFILIDDKKITGFDRVEFVVDQELPAAGDGVIDFVAVMDMHIHGLFFFIKMGNGEGLGGSAAFNGLPAGRKFFHNEGPFM